MGTYYRNLQIAKHALRYYIARPKANEKDLVREKNLLKAIEKQIENFEERHHITKEEQRK
ncbi:MAG: hypothetical protein KHX58_03940 [Coprobacillus sp.]|nr:hypothetical protein [Coprobacillus sp.]